jgi:hypothetical protein
MQYTQANGIESNASYPYVSGTGKTSSCSYNANNVVFKNTASSFVKPSNN